MFALRPETSLRIYTYAPDRHSLPVRQTLPPVRKTETEEKTVRRLLLQIPARLRKVLTIINCGEATLLPPRFLFFNPSSQRRPFLFRHRERSVAIPKIGVRTSMQFTPSFGDGIAAVASLPRKDVIFYSVIASAAWQSRGAVCECLYNLLRRLERDCRGRFAPSQRRLFLFCHRVDDVSLLFVDEGYGRNTERNAVVFVGIFFGGFTVCPIAAELEVRRTYGKRLGFGLEMVRSEQVS